MLIRKPTSLAVAAGLVGWLLLPLSPAVASGFNEYAVPTSNSEPEVIVNGPDGALWFTETNTNKIGRVTTSGSFTEFSLPDTGNPGCTGPTALTAGPDGALWYASCGKIGRLDTLGSTTEYTVPDTGTIQFMVTGPDGAIWYTDSNDSLVGRITTSGSVTTYTIPTSNAWPLGITSGPDGALWFTEGSNSDNGSKIGRITTAGAFTEYNVGSVLGLDGITTGSDGNLWFTESANNRLGQITTSGTITQFDAPLHAAIITSGADGALWFSVPSSNKIDRITTAGTVSEFTVPTTSSLPFGVASGSDNAIWFAEALGNKIGSIGTALPAAPTGLTASSPTNNPVLSWSSVTGADHYNVYRDGTNVGTATGTTYTDSAAADGTHTYAVSAVDNAGREGAQSSSLNVLVDKTAPTINYSLSPTPNAAGWNNSNVTVTFTCSDGGSGIASCSSPVVVSTEGSNQQVTGTAVDNAGNSSSVTATVKLDKTVPTVSGLTMSSTTFSSGTSVTISANASDTLSGVVGGEYYVDSDPGQGNGTGMTYAGGAISVTHTITGSKGNHTLFVRSKDSAGNWSTTVSKTFKIR
jgi:virginiamycin B lyase